MKNLAGLFLAGELFALSELAAVPLVYVLLRRGKSTGLGSELGLLAQGLGSTAGWRNLALFWGACLLTALITVISYLLLPGRGREFLKRAAIIPGAILLAGFSFAIYLMELSWLLPVPRREFLFLINTAAALILWLGAILVFGRRAGVGFGVFSALGCFSAVNVGRCLFIVFNLTIGPGKFGLLLFLNAALFGLCSGLGLFLDRRDSRYWSGLKGFSAAAILMSGVLLISGPLLSWRHYYFSGPQNSAKPNVVMIVMDTVRADHLSLYGYKRDTTPFLEKLSAKSVVFENAYSASPWTLPSHASFFTGLLPSEHKCTYENMKLSSQFPTLAQRLKDSGYFTIGWSNNSLLNYSSGLTRGFDRFVENSQLSLCSGEATLKIFRSKSPELSSDNGARLANRALFQWLSRMKANKKPFFLFVNYMEAHTPYVTDAAAYRYFHDPGKAQRDYVSPSWDEFNCRRKTNPRVRSAAVRWYDGSIYYLDAELGKLYRQLEGLGLLENSVVIILSDHGESFGEHGFWGHGLTLYNSELRVPLLVSYPRLLNPQRLENVYSLKDLPGLVLKLIDGKIPKEISSPGASGGEIFSEVFKPVTYIERFSQYCPGFDIGSLDRRKKSLVDMNYKLVWESSGKEMLFDLEQDPGEKLDVSGSDPEVMSRMHESMARFINGHPYSSKPHRIDSATVNALRALGYAR